jgi:hypothetical protein
MVRLRNVLMAVALGTAVAGCSHPPTYAHWSLFHCSECDDFPTPSYGPNYSMAPGGYSGPASENKPDASRMTTPSSSNVPAPNNESIVTPPEERPITPPGTPNATPPTPPAATPPPGETP